MFRTDRPHWSSKDGKIHCPRESFQLPSSHWRWESDWHIDESLPSDSQVIMLFEVYFPGLNSLCFRISKYG